ncbi:dienelactone hydrolase family protein [Nocardia sp. CA-129566]|uniref:dienelactone hydrolase family protein n=1 Tax=Nocardia sp. CA-129566 TaxID=3239976 RepID=UPI003D96B1B3
MPESAVPAAHAKFFAALGPMRAAFTPEKALQDAQTYLDRLSAAEFVTPGPVAVSGYRMGGKLTLCTAGAFGNRIAAAASFHGGRVAVDEQRPPPRVTAADPAGKIMGRARRSADGVELRGCESCRRSDRRSGAAGRRRPWGR